MSLPRSRGDIPNTHIPLPPEIDDISVDDSAMLRNLYDVSVELVEHEKAPRPLWVDNDPTDNTSVANETLDELVDAGRLTSLERGVIISMSNEINTLFGNVESIDYSPDDDDLPLANLFLEHMIRMRKGTINNPQSRLTQLHQEFFSIVDRLDSSEGPLLVPEKLKERTRSADQLSVEISSRSPNVSNDLARKTEAHDFDTSTDILRTLAVIDLVTFIKHLPDDALITYNKDIGREEPGSAYSIEIAKATMFSIAQSVPWETPLEMLYILNARNSSGGYLRPYRLINRNKFKAERTKGRQIVDNLKQIADHRVAEEAILDFRRSDFATIETLDFEAVTKTEDKLKEELRLAGKLAWALVSGEDRTQNSVLGALSIESWIAEVLGKEKLGKIVKQTWTNKPLHKAIEELQLQQDLVTLHEAIVPLQTRASKIIRNNKISSKFLRSNEGGLEIVRNLEIVEDVGSRARIFGKAVAKQIAGLAIKLGNNPENSKKFISEINELRQIRADLDMLEDKKDHKFDLLRAVDTLLEFEDSGANTGKNILPQKVSNLIEVLKAQENDNTGWQKAIEESDIEDIHVFPPGIGPSVILDDLAKISEGYEGAQIEWDRIKTLVELRDQFVANGASVNIVRSMSSTWHQLPHYILEIENESGRRIAVIESPIYGNATYITPQNEDWKEIVLFSKAEARELGAIAKVHMPVDDRVHHREKIFKEVSKQLI